MSDDSPNPKSNLADAIRARIVSGEMALGQAISDKQLSVEYATSRTPVREALLELRAAGLVVTVPQKGTYVFSPQAKDIAEICQMRGLLEAGALRAAAALDLDRLVAALNKSVAQMAFAIEAGDFVRIEQCDTRFHESLVSLCGNSRLVGAYRQISDQVRVLRHQLPARRQRVQDALAQHRRIVDLLTAERVDDASDEILLHVDRVHSLLEHPRHDTANPSTKTSKEAPMTILHRALRVTLAAVSLLSATAVFAQEAFPSKPIHIIVTLSAGSQVDILARLIGQKLATELGQSVIVENKPGAGGTIAAQFVASAPGDGYTLLMTANGHAINPALYPKLRFDTAKDFSGVSLVAVVPSVLVVSPKVPAKTAGDLIELMRAHPGQYNYGSPGIGSAGHMATALFNLDANVTATHVPYKGTPEALADVMSGRVEYFFAPLGAALPYITNNSVKALGVSTLERSPALPNVPPIADSGLPGYTYVFWYGLVAPSATPPAVVAKLANGVQQALQSADLKAVLATQGAVPSKLAGASFDEFLTAEIKKSAQLVKVSGAAPESR